jgi:L-phenylalanine/L-methionine N-acetyltransferase
VAVLAGFRGIGLGEALVSDAILRAKEIGVWLVELRVFSTNLPAIGLYKKLGFRRSGRTPNMILKNGRYIDDIQMYIDLRQTH